LRLSVDLNPDKVWMSKELESHGNNLLREKYTSTEYIPIPDQNNGDGGVEKNSNITTKGCYLVNDDSESAFCYHRKSYLLVLIS